MITTFTFVSLAVASAFYFVGKHRKASGLLYALAGIGGLTVLRDLLFPLLRTVVGLKYPSFWNIWMTLLCGGLMLLGAFATYLRPIRR